MSQYKNSIAVSGAHGKTTTTSMITGILIKSDCDPTAHIGAEYAPIGGTTRIGRSEFFIAEACEYCESFLQLRPRIALIMNVDLDHVDHYRDATHFRDAFKSFSMLTPNDGRVVANGDDPECIKIYDNLPANEQMKWIFFGVRADVPFVCDYQIRNLEFDQRYCGSFDVCFKQEHDLFRRIQLNVPGLHNVYNSLAALAVCHTVGCPTDGICEGLAEYSGAKKRFETLGTVNGITIIDDYAHHPSEIVYALQTGKKLANGAKLFCVFQPHTYTRTRYFMDGFASALRIADTVILTDIYAARESNPGDVNSDILANEINRIGGHAKYMETGFKGAAEYILEHGQPGDIVITMGAGEAVKTAEILLVANPI